MLAEAPQRAAQDSSLGHMLLAMTSTRCSFNHVTLFGIEVGVVFELQLVCGTFQLRTASPYESTMRFHHLAGATPARQLKLMKMMKKEESG